MSSSKNLSLFYKLMTFLVFMSAYGVLYVIPNFFSDQPAGELPLLWIDKVVPLVPWTFLIYTSDYLVFLITILWLTEKEDFLSFTRMMFGVLGVCGLFFYSYPTIYPRPDYASFAPGGVIGAAMEFIAVADSPRNCFPSMHVGLTAVATWSLRKKGPKILGLFGLWSLAIFASTLTTKQHYFLDIIGGLAVMILIAFVEHRLISPRFRRFSQ